MTTLPVQKRIYVNTNSKNNTYKADSYLQYKD
jgi:hypothetical protein